MPKERLGEMSDPIQDAARKALNVEGFVMHWLPGHYQALEQSIASAIREQVKAERERMRTSILTEINKEYRQYDCWAKQTNIEAAVNRALKCPEVVSHTSESQEIERKDR